MIRQIIGCVKRNVKQVSLQISFIILNLLDRFNYVGKEWNKRERRRESERQKQTDRQRERESERDGKRGGVVRSRMKNE